MNHGVFKSSNRVCCGNCQSFYFKRCKKRKVSVNPNEVCESLYRSSHTGNSYLIEVKHFSNKTPKLNKKPTKRTQYNNKYIPYVTTEKKEKRSHPLKDDGSFYHSKAWRSLRVKAILKYGRKCCLCGRSVKDGIVLHVDHIKPRSKFPKLELKLWNLQILCEDCNLGKSNHYQDDWKS